MSAWLIVASWWAQGALERPRHKHLTTDPACVNFRAPRPYSWLDRASRGLECEPCMVSRALGDDECRPFLMTGSPAAPAVPNTQPEQEQ